MGYVETVVTVLESDRVAQLTVAISMPPGADPIETSFFLLVNTSDGTATGLHTHEHVHTTHTLDLATLVKISQQRKSQRKFMKCLERVIVSSMSGTLNMAKSTQVTPKVKQALDSLRTIRLENESCLFCSELHACRLEI